MPDENDNQYCIRRCTDACVCTKVEVQVTMSRRWCLSTEVLHRAEANLRVETNVDIETIMFQGSGSSKRNYSNLALDFKVPSKGVDHRDA